MSINRSTVFQERIPDPYVLLVEISHPFLETPIRAVTNTSNVVSNGKTYLAAQVNITVPTEGERIQTASITVANVDKRIGLAAQQLITPATISMDVVNANDPDTIEIDYPPLRLTNVTGNVISVTGELEGFLNLLEPWPKLRATKTLFPALYAP